MKTTEKCPCKPTFLPVSDTPGLFEVLGCATAATVYVERVPGGGWSAYGNGESVPGIFRTRAEAYHAFAEGTKSGRAGAASLREFARRVKGGK